MTSQATTPYSARVHQRIASCTAAPPVDQSETYTLNVESKRRTTTDRPRTATPATGRAPRLVVAVGDAGRRQGILGILGSARRRSVRPAATGAGLSVHVCDERKEHSPRSTLRTQFAGPASFCQPRITPSHPLAPQNNLIELTTDLVKSVKSL